MDDKDTLFPPELEQRKTSKSKISIKGLKQKLTRVDPEISKQIQEVKQTKRYRIRQVHQEENARIRVLREQIKEDERRKKAQDKILRSQPHKQAKMILKEKERQRRFKERNEQQRLKKLKKQQVMEIKQYKKNNEEYKIKNAMTIKFVRMALWVCIGFIFLKGLIAVLKPTELDQVQALISDFSNEYKAIDNNYELFSFAERFAKDYFTYNNNSTDYIKSLGSYVSPNVSFVDVNVTDKNSRAIYVEAFKKDDYSSNQKDVYVYVETQYAGKETIDDKIIDVTKRAEYTVKIPVMQNDNQFIVEDLPVFVNDRPAKLSNYKASIVSEADTAIKKADEGTTERIRTSLHNFFNLYYGGDQAAINYYLKEGAEKEKFMGLGENIQFKDITELQAFILPDSVPGTYLCLVTLKVSGENGYEYPQKYNVTVAADSKNEDKFYIQDINTKTVNISY